MISLLNNPARPLTKSSQRPSSWARFSTKFIILACWVWVRSHLQWRTPQTRTLQLAPSVGITDATMKCDSLLRQGQTPRGNDDGQPTGPQMENCQEVPSSTGVWHHVHGPRPHQGPDDPRTSRAAPVRPRQRKMTAARNTFKRLRGENSSWRLVLVSSNSLEESNRALAWANPQETEPRSCMVLGLKPMGKLITRDKYISVKQNQGLAWSSDSNLWEN